MTGKIFPILPQGLNLLMRNSLDFEISNSKMIFYNSSMFPELKGKAIIGDLTSHELIIAEINCQEAHEVKRIPLGARIRDVEQAADGSIYVLTDQDNRNVWKLTSGK